MIKFPVQFRALPKYPGYFWNVEDKKLYSIKIKGVLKPLKKKYPNRFNNMYSPFYEISINGQRKYISVDRIVKICVPHHLIVPEYKKEYYDSGY